MLDARDVRVGALVVPLAAEPQPDASPQIAARLRADERQAVVAAALARERVVERERGHRLAHRVAVADRIRARVEVPLDLEHAERRRTWIARLTGRAVALGARLLVALGAHVPVTLLHGLG